MPTIILCVGDTVVTKKDKVSAHVEFIAFFYSEINIYRPCFNAL